jgi:hypothetical protein
MAAGLVMAAGAALGFSGSEMSYREGRLAFRLGRGPTASPEAARLKMEVASLRARIDALQSQHAALAAAVTSPAPAAGPAIDVGVINAAFRRQVQERDQRLVAAFDDRTTAMQRRWAEQRRVDLAMTRAAISMVQSQSTLTDAEHEKMIALAYPASEQK